MGHYRVNGLIPLSTFGTVTSLYFYSYITTNNIYNQTTTPSYWVDKNGYAHINTPLGSIITDRPLTKK